MRDKSRTYVSRRGITRLVLVAVMFASTFTSIELASSAELYKVRVGEIGKTDLFLLAIKHSNIPKEVITRTSVQICI